MQTAQFPRVEFIFKQNKKNVCHTESKNIRMGWDIQRVFKGFAMGKSFDRFSTHRDTHTDFFFFLSILCVAPL